MTTRINIESAPNLFLTNEIINLNQPAYAALAKSLAGASLIAKEPLPQDSLRLVLKFLLGEIKEKLPSQVLFLLIGTQAWQPNTRVVRHHKLWGALIARGLKAPMSADSSLEVMLESGEGLKFFGAAKVADFAIEDIVQILLSEHCTYIVALPSDVPAKSLLSIGWSGDLSNDSKLLGCLAESDALLLKQVGAFDDRERGIVAIGRPSVVSGLFG